jgi:hypothetical protein
MGWEGINWINGADWLKGQVIGCCEHGNEPSRLDQKLFASQEGLCFMLLFVWLVNLYCAFYSVRPCMS